MIASLVGTNSTVRVIWQTEQKIGRQPPSNHGHVCSRHYESNSNRCQGKADEAQRPPKKKGGRGPRWGGPEQPKTVLQAYYIEVALELLETELPYALHTLYSSRVRPGVEPLCHICCHHRVGGVVTAGRRSRRSWKTLQRERRQLEFSPRIDAP